MAGREVRVVYTKYDGSLHWHMAMRYLGEDEHGIWLGVPAHTSIRRGTEPPVVMEQPFVGLFPDGQWWTATFNGDPAGTEVYCDIGTPPRWLSPTEVTMADLDLDVPGVARSSQVTARLAAQQPEFACPVDRFFAAVHSEPLVQALGPLLCR
jgi:uncharacterized protein